MQIKPAHAYFAPALLAIALALGACGKQENKEQQQPQKPVAVGVVTIEPRTVTLTDELPGRTSAFRIAEVRPQVSGILLKRNFVEGGDVKAGQQLYQIDPRTYEANVNSAKASLAQAQATLASNRLKAQRYGALVKEQAISKQEADDALSMQRQNEAQVESAKAALRNAEINLAYTKVAAPISGRIGRSMMTEGALVTADQTSALTSITQLDPIYVDVTQSATDLLRLRRELDSGQLQRVQGENAAEVKLVLEDGSAYSRPGKLKFAEVSVDQGTGSVVIRAEFPNPDKLLLPGMFVRARLQAGVRQDALLVPQQGVTRDIKGQPTAMVVTAEGKVEQRVLKTERTVGSDWLVTEGIKPGDKVITEGLQKVRPGATVTATPASNVASAGQPPAGQGQ
ncbi:efflux RND transporter periplasmic adaptor subunit [Pseudomonas oryzihabitans]|uniref:efflux RND transporter periplasmic adaptor subunit n=1 Tax=Pseudomonas oryzihabitans TaxID=47885 RepID=UPI00285BF253|nr:efflux RND transporter periplasmic adaptor subunit [Pseudomonas psychrotolerans]MDR6678548.1 membrane fusion protein (multidrug efflux system) [Pseudomonas psychrotolerans]